MRNRFILVSNIFCKNVSGSNGIIIYKNKIIRLKISGNLRLIGNLTEKNKISYLYFDKLIKI
jgi:hypothetical protein